MSDEIGLPPTGRAPGWYPSPDKAGYGEYWSGSAWTGIVRSDVRSEPDAPTVPAAAAAPKTLGLHPSTLLGIVAGGIWLFVSVLSSGFPGLLMGGGTLALFTAVYVLITGRRSWLLLPSRKAGTLLLTAGLIASFVGGGLAPKTGQSDARSFADKSQINSNGSPTTTPPQTAKPSSTPAASRPQPVPDAQKRIVTTKDVVEVQDVPFAKTLVSNPNLAAGTNQITTAGVAGKNNLTYRLVLTDGVETSRTLLKTLVISPPVAEVTSQGTYVAPVAAPVPAPAPAPAPATITPGAFCADAAVGASGLGANGRTYVCGSKGADAKGHYHWNS
ncbi:MAG: G5 domain-containing protein [Rhodoglobus sp.]